MMSRIGMMWCGVWCLSLFCLGERAVAADPGEFVLSAGNFDRADCPVRLELPQSLQSPAALELQDLDGMVHVPVQRLSNSEAMFILSGPIAKGTQRRFRLSASPNPEPVKATIRCDVDRGLATFRTGGAPILAFNVDPAEPPDGLDRHFRRSGHIHPVWTPNGHIVTDQFVPADVHKHGIYSAWVNADFEGRNIDFWNQWKLQGTVENRKLFATQEGPVFGSLTTEMAYVDRSVPPQRRDALYESWNVRVYAVKEGRLFDIESKQRCAQNSPVTLRQHNYGGMAVRGPYAWQKQPECDFLTSEGKNRIEGNYTRPNWVNMHGLVDGEMCGLTTFSSPSNFRAPQMVRLHPELTYFVFTPVRLGEFQINPGETYESKFRFYVEDGATDAAKLQQVWADYVEPPTIEWVK